MSADAWYLDSSALVKTVIEEPESTTFLGAGECARVHDTGALEVSW